MFLGLNARLFSVLALIVLINRRLKYRALLATPLSSTLAIGLDQKWILTLPFPSRWDRRPLKTRHLSQGRKTR
jgi:hypothetical protein